MGTTRRAMITGMGAVSPLGLGVDALWDGWIAGRVTFEDGRAACRAFDEGPPLPRRERHRLDRFVQLAAVAAIEALEAAGWSAAAPYDPARVGCIIGTAIGGIGTLEQQVAIGQAGERSISPLAITQAMGNGAAAWVSLRHGIRGATFAPVSACAAGAHAIGLGLRLIQFGEADAVVCGGSEACLTSFPIGAMASMGASSSSGTTRPFDIRRDGFVMGEGAGLIVLEERDAARRRGAPMIAELLGFGQTNDAHHITAPEPDGRVAAAAITAALRDAGRPATDVAYINAHGTATKLNDLAETRAIELALGAHATAVPVSSLKSAIGHLIGAAGAVEAIATVRALVERVAPPTLSLEQPDPQLRLDFVPLTARELRHTGARRVALSNAFGFGGHNAVLAIGTA